MKKFNTILLINPPYERAGVSESVSSVSISLSLAMLGAICQNLGRNTKVLDLNLYFDWTDRLLLTVHDYEPDLVGITFTTPTYYLANEIAKTIKRENEKDVTIVGGGAHATALPRETLMGSAFDGLAIGEADLSFQELIKTADKNTPGWFWKSDNNFVKTGVFPQISFLDNLPHGAFDLFDTEKYIYPEETSRKNPVCLLETSRGCYAKCSFCNKNIFGHRIRKKSSRRIVDEIEYILSCGFGEIHLSDDSFTADLNHAKGMCDEILARGLKFPWVPRSGIRVDRITGKVLEIMRKAGCYHVPFGIESGSQNVINRINKGITIEQVRNSVKIAKELEFETTGYFMIGLPGETVETLMKTLDFASELQLDHVKFGFTIPLPGTPMFEELEEIGNLLTRDWNKFTYTTPSWEIFGFEDKRLRAFIESVQFNDHILVDIANKSLHFDYNKKNYVLNK